MRFTIVDSAGTISFAGPPHGLKALAAGCSKGATDYRALLESLAIYDAQLASSVLDGLAVFDEHVVADNPRSVEEWLSNHDQAARKPLRVVDFATRQLSLEPCRLGVVLFNLNAQRIVQLQNSYAELQRNDRGRLRIDGKPVNRYYTYRLPGEWEILP
jgi:hypothetical protein